MIPAGVEPAIFWMRTRRPRPLDDGTEVRTKRKFIFSLDERGFVSHAVASGTEVHYDFVNEVSLATQWRPEPKFITFFCERGFVSRVAASGTNVYSIPYLYKNAKISYNNSYEKASNRSIDWAN